MLTDAKVKTALSKTKAYKMHDSKGLFLFVTPTAKLWRLKYKFQGKEKLMSFGGYPIVTLAKARERSLDALRLLDGGLDPMAVRNATKGHLEPGKWDFKRLSEDWLEFWRVGKAKATVEAAERRLRHVVAFLGNRLLDEIQIVNVVNMIREMELREAATLPGACLEVTNQVFRRGVALGICKSNPAGAFKRRDVLKAVEGDNHPRVNEPELPRLLCQVDTYPSPIVRLAMKMMALTFVRTSELISAEWSEIDFEARRWNIPKEKMKGGKNPHIVPLSNQALECLQVLKALKRNQWVFPGVKLRGSLGRDAIVCALQVMGYKGKMTGHGFRGVASTILHERGYNHLHIETQLAHISQARGNRVASAYNYALYLEPRTVMMQEWADYLDAAIQGKSTAKPERELLTQKRSVAPARSPIQ